ncbi:uncharacterized protein LOC126470451 isoform X3 [Schistocerca serialis cubense]|uniref:uncharacterized protein LOC126470451 isoform X2 n=1 Tax=Schistocerca serialis cubense TaxID=2023355 RepID=UPI00214EACB9|nr:uncharacterized protein LOC126470451 isoform X2 [Schistocerca serialis cubense]XP_049954257.1 uncharacterized protein LOC126470451 isoform X3 [Schistocerca serialis cubense]
MWLSVRSDFKKMKLFRLQVCMTKLMRVKFQIVKRKLYDLEYMFVCCRVHEKHSLLWTCSPYLKEEKEEMPSRILKTEHIVELITLMWMMLEAEVKKPSLKLFTYLVTSILSSLGEDDGALLTC